MALLHNLSANGSLDQQESLQGVLPSLSGERVMGDGELPFSEVERNLRVLGAPFCFLRLRESAWGPLCSLLAVGGTPSFSETVG